MHRAWLWLAALLLLVGSGCRAEFDHAAALRDRIASSDVSARRAAVDELRQLGDLSSENLLLAERALNDEDSLVRQAAAQVLIVQAAERPELGDRLVAWAGMTSDPQCRELFEHAAVGKMPGDAAP